MMMVSWFDSAVHWRKMHELGIAQDILNKALDTAHKEGAQKVTRVHVKVGEHTAVDVADFRFCFDALKAGTIASEAELAVETAPPAECRVCKTSFSPEADPSACPACGSSEVEIMTGRELYVDSVELV
jgi:hydrogenase nickel incorporation protein HypA/HybF